MSTEDEITTCRNYYALIVWTTNKLLHWTSSKLENRLYQRGKWKKWMWTWTRTQMWMWTCI